MLSEKIDKYFNLARKKASEYTQKYCPSIYAVFQLYEKGISKIKSEIIKNEVSPKIGIDLFEQKNIELNNKLYKIEWESHNKILQLEAENQAHVENAIALDKTINKLKADKAELQKALIRFVKCSCYACPDGVENPNEECRGCGYYDYIKLLEKQFNKSWEEIKDLK